MVLGLSSFAQNGLEGSWSLHSFQKIELLSNTPLPVEQTIFGVPPKVAFRITPDMELKNDHFAQQSIKVILQVTGEGELLLKFAKTYAAGEAGPSMNGVPLTESVTQTNFNYSIDGKTLRLFRQDPSYLDEYIFVRD